MTEKRTTMTGELKLFSPSPLSIYFLAMGILDDSTGGRENGRCVGVSS